jgi:hypothetical protein
VRRIAPASRNRSGGERAHRSDRGPRPIVVEYELACTAQAAFRTYTQRIGEWWDPIYTSDPGTLESVTIEPRVGGRVFATHRGGVIDEWGRVTAWDRGRLLKHTFTLAQDPGAPTELLIEFSTSRPRTASGSGCRVRFAHGGWTRANRDARAKFTDWRTILDRFAALAEAGTRVPQRGVKAGRGRE